MIDGLADTLHSRRLELMPMEFPTKPAAPLPANVIPFPGLSVIIPFPGPDSCPTELRAGSVAAGASDGLTDNPAAPVASDLTLVPLPPAVVVPLPQAAGQPGPYADGDLEVEIDVAWPGWPPKANPDASPHNVEVVDFPDGGGRANAPAGEPILPVSFTRRPPAAP